MTVTKIEAVPNSKNKYKIYVDEQFAFVLYKGELSRYRLEAGNEIEDMVYGNIMEQVIFKRAKLRALHLLNAMGRTEKQLRQKLKENDYTEEIIERTLQYVKSFGYVNDFEYARSFILNRKDKKSRKELYLQLSQKGVSSDVLDEIFEECYDDSSAREAISIILQKKKYNPETATPKDTQKILSYLTRKGFSYEDVRQLLQVSEWNA